MLLTYLKKVLIAISTSTTKGGLANEFKKVAFAVRLAGALTCFDVQIRPSPPSTMTKLQLLC